MSVGAADSRIRGFHWRPGRVSSLLLVHGGAQLTERASRPDGTVQQPVTPSAGGCRDSGDADGDGGMSSTLERRKRWDWQSIGFRGGVGAAGWLSVGFWWSASCLFFIEGPPVSNPQVSLQSQERVAPKKERDAAGKASQPGRTVSSSSSWQRWQRESLPHSTG